MDASTRQEYIRAAISFLQNPKLVESPLKEKLKFLRDKGLSDVEVDEALNLALIHRNQSDSGKWNFLLILGVCLGGYKLYMSYLEQKSRPAESKPNKVSQEDQRLAAYAAANREALSLDKNQPTLNDILQKMTELKKLVELQRTTFGTEIQSLKTLMLGHEKFAAPPKIPEWQLPSTHEKSSTKESNNIQSSSKPEGGAKKNKSDKGKNKNSDSKQSISTNGIIDPTPLAGSSPE